MSIFLVHHFPIIRNEVSQIISKQYPSTQIYCYDSLSNFTSKIKMNDILVIYLDFPNLNLLKTLKELQKNGAKIILWIESEDETAISLFLQQRFQGYLHNEIENSQLREALEAIETNTSYLQTSLSPMLFKQYLNENNYYTDPPISPLTKREWEVLKLLTSGFSNERVANELFLTESTVKNHVSSILHKLEVPDRTCAVLKAIKNKWITL